MIQKYIHSEKGRRSTPAWVLDYFDLNYSVACFVWEPKDVKVVKTLWSMVIFMFVEVIHIHVKPAFDVDRYKFYSIQHFSLQNSSNCL
jgi:hypothetical protein